eukprot:NODE_835_length_3822_cov_0.626377.p4 type:complete len:103 gc:universal NODE_835_length_3822_cov_0.626377:1141-833(-)
MYILDVYIPCCRVLSIVTHVVRIITEELLNRWFTALFIVDLFLGIERHLIVLSLYQFLSVNKCILQLLVISLDLTYSGLHPLIPFVTMKNIECLRYRKNQKK